MNKPVEERALKVYGATDNPFDAGYIITNGTMLDFSEGGGMGRTQDHRNITQFFNYDKTKTGAATKQMIKFIKRGNIRLMPEAKGIEFFKIPTPQQLDTIKYICEWWGKNDVIIEQTTNDGNYSKLIGNYYEFMRQHNTSRTERTYQ